MAKITSTIVILLSLLIFTAACGQKKGSLKEGDKVPSFTLKDQNGKDFNIDSYVGKHKMVIYFYPKDESGVCTKEACAFRDSYADYVAAGAMVIGINSGTVESHKSFAANHNLPFTLLSDPDNKVLKQFGIKDVLFMTGRETFVVDLTGKVVYRFRGMMQGTEHSEQALGFLKGGK